MDAVRFIKERNRMCNKHHLCFVDEDEVCCRMVKKMVAMDCCDYRDADTIICAAFLNKYPEEAVQVVEQWSKDNPPVIDWTKVSVGTHVQVKDFSNTNWNPAIYEFGLYLPNAPHKFIVLDDDRENAQSLLWYDFCKLADDVDPTPYYKD